MALSKMDTPVVFDYNGVVFTTKQVDPAMVELIRSLVAKGVTVYVVSRAKLKNAPRTVKALQESGVLDIIPPEHVVFCGDQAGSVTGPVDLSSPAELNGARWASRPGGGGVGKGAVVRALGLKSATMVDDHAEPCKSVSAACGPLRTPQIHFGPKAEAVNTDKVLILAARTVAELCAHLAL